MQWSTFGFCIIEERKDTGWIVMSITTLFPKLAVGRHDESSIFGRSGNDIKNQTGCTYRGRGGFPSSRLRLSISVMFAYSIKNMSFKFSGHSQVPSLLEALTWVLPTISADRLSGKPSNSRAAKTTRDWRAFYRVPNDWE